VTVPASIQRLLDNHNVSYTLADMPHTMPLAPINHITNLREAGAARSVVLENDSGSQLLAITPSDALLDLNRVEQVMSSSYNAVTGEKLQALFDKHGVQALPALPQLDNLPTLVDKRLLENDVVYLDAGIDEQYLQLSQADFQQLVGNTVVSDISTPLAALEAPVEPECDETQILASVSQFTELRVKQRLEETLEMPPLPSTAQRIIQLRVDPNADIGDLATIVEVDPSLAAQVVSWAASPYYSAPGTIKSIHDAIVRVLGFDMVLNLALGLALGKTLEMPKKGPYGVIPYWQQSVYVAATVEALVTIMPRDSRPSFGTAYLAGLLNNFGYLILAEVFPPHFEKINRHIEANPHVSPHGIDRHLVGINRDQLSGWLMEFWNMPESICNALRHQNDPTYDGEDSEYSLLIYLANNLLRQHDVITGASLQPIPDTVYKQLNIDPEQAKEVVANILESNEELKAIAQELEG